MRKALIAGAVSLALTTLIAPAQADEVIVDVNLISADGIGKSIGTVTAMDSDNGLVLLLDLSADLSPGPHGFHVHQNPSCDPAEKEGAMVAGLSAGGHFDPAETGKHLGPSGEGHLGDLPVLYVKADAQGAAQPVKQGMVAPRLSVSDIRGRALMIHASGDNFRDDPKPLGGGGARVACGVIPQ